MLCGSQMRPILCLMILTSYLMVRGSIRGAKESPPPRLLPLFRTAAPNRSRKKYTSGNNFGESSEKKNERGKRRVGKRKGGKTAEEMRGEKRCGERT